MRPVGRTNARHWRPTNQAVSPSSNLDKNLCKQRGALRGVHGFQPWPRRKGLRGLVGGAGPNCFTVFCQREADEESPLPQSLSLLQRLGRPEPHHGETASAAGLALVPSGLRAGWRASALGGRPCAAAADTARGHRCSGTRGAPEGVGGPSSWNGVGRARFGGEKEMGGPRGVRNVAPGQVGRDPRSRRAAAWERRRRSPRRGAGVEGWRPALGQRDVRAVRRRLRGEGGLQHLLAALGLLHGGGAWGSAAAGRDRRHAIWCPMRLQSPMPLAWQSTVAGAPRLAFS